MFWAMKNSVFFKTRERLQKIYSDNYHLKRADIETFPIPLSKITNDVIKTLKKLYKHFQHDVERCAITRNTEAYSETKIIKEYKLMDARYHAHLIDDVICSLYGLTDEEREFIRDFEIKFRIDEQSDLPYVRRRKKSQ